jgi:hypothetical protein
VNASAIFPRAVFDDKSTCIGFFYYLNILCSVVIPGNNPPRYRTGTHKRCPYAGEMLNKLFFADFVFRVKIRTTNRL